MGGQFPYILKICSGESVSNMIENLPCFALVGKKFKIVLLDITIKIHKLIIHTKTRKKVNHNLIELFCLLMQNTCYIV